MPRDHSPGLVSPTVIGRRDRIVASGLRTGLREKTTQSGLRTGLREKTTQSGLRTGLREKTTHDYKRIGTTTLFGTLEVNRRQVTDPALT